MQNGMAVKVGERVLCAFPSGPEHGRVLRPPYSCGAFRDNNPGEFPGLEDEELMVDVELDDGTEKSVVAPQVTRAEAAVL